MAITGLQILIIYLIPLLLHKLKNGITCMIKEVVLKMLEKVASHLKISLPSQGHFITSKELGNLFIPLKSFIF